jgi:hypothetical protein
MAGKQMTNNNARPFDRVSEHADEWLTENDLTLPAEYFPPGPEIGLYLLHSADAYAHGYKMAADRLAGVQNCDFGIERHIEYPIMFLYRHYIELELKQIIDLVSHLERNPAKARDTHDLLKLWNRARLAIERYWPEEQKVHLDRAGFCISNFDKLDRTSQSFRYPHDKDGKVAVGSLRTINPTRLSGIMLRLANILGFCINRLYSRLN